MNQIIINRKNNEYVTIAHITDLHITPKNSSPRFNPNPDIRENWEGLIKDIASQNPDLLCVTGDLIDNPYNDLLKKASDKLNPFKFIPKLFTRSNKKSEFNQWHDIVKKTFEDVRSLLERICIQAKISTESCLFVIPGNHDYRIQGFLEESDLVKTAESTREIFKDVFKEYYRDKRIAFNTQNQKQNSSIITSIAGFDSLAPDQIANFATGAISLEEYRKFDFFDEKLNNIELNGNIEFRISLIHHHPLPVVTTEYFREIKFDTIKKSSKGKITAAIDIFQAEQGTVFKNAGTFIYGALKRKVDLILHGHQHHSWFTQLRYPSIENGEHRLLVAGAASIGEMTDGKCKYNIIRLYRNGNITVEERSRQNNPPDYEGEEIVRLYSDSELRLARILRSKRDLQNKLVEGFENLKYNIAQCDMVLRRTDIKMDGSAYYQVKFNNLRTTHEDISKLIIASEYPIGVYTAKPKINTDNTYYTVEVEKEKSSKDDSYTWAIYFKPNLSKKLPVTLTIQYQIYNAFDFVKEYHLARTKNEIAKEVEGYLARLIIPDKLVQTVSFPEQWKPCSEPNLSVDDENGSHDRDETLYHQKSLEYIENKGVVTISIDRPIPGYCYKISWELDEINDYEKKRYDEKYLNEAKKINFSKINERETDFVNILNELFNKYSDNLFNSHTELSLFIVKKKDQIIKSQKAIDLVLERIAFKGAEDSPTINIKEHRSGDGLIGQSYRSGESKTVSRNEIENMIGYKHDETICNIEHEALWCIPLHVPTDNDLDKSRSPIYAILCAGTFHRDGSLYKGEDDIFFNRFEKMVINDINKSVFGILIMK